MRIGTRHFVCDRCGTYWRERGEFGPYVFCSRCGSVDVSKFSRPIAAMEHAAHIKERRRNGEDAQATERAEAS